jgi:hypothetical protein
MIIPVTNILHTQVIVERIIIEKTIFGASRETLDICTIETKSPGGCHVIIGILVARSPLGDQRTKNHLAAVRQLRDKQLPNGC